MKHTIRKHYPCQALARGEAGSCAWPWTPGEPHVFVGPVRQPCIQCRIARVLLDVWQCAESAAALARRRERASRTLRARLEEHRGVRSVLAAIEAGDHRHYDCYTEALRLARAYGSETAALHAIARNEGGGFVDLFYTEDVAWVLRLMPLTFAEGMALRAERALEQGREAAE